ncbi:MAG: DUF2961 domain-containing protein [Acidobacteria bacterium]|nr:DUF2961 domain-containing protein [Acidobacteriota bacterium]
MPSGLGHLFLAREGRRRRSSSWDRTGKNADRVGVDPGATAVIADISGAGCIRHIWITIGDEEPGYLRRLVLRAFWDGETSPSVETPIGDFFGVGHARVSNYWCLPLNMVTGGGPQARNQAAMNCFFPMPFARGARLTVENQGQMPVQSLYYYVDYEEYDRLPGEALRFHAQWRRENPTKPSIHVADRSQNLIAATKEIVNLDGKSNYVILEAAGRGHYAGCNLSIDHLNPMPNYGWFGEGDDMIFIDGETMPSLVGTGTEDYFCAAWGYPGGLNSMPYHGISLAGPTDGPAPYSGKWTMYRYHIEDPVLFAKSIKVTIEHGPANIHASDYSSVAYWYQTEPHAPFPPLLPVDQRLPIPDRDSLRQFWRTY